MRTTSTPTLKSSWRASTVWVLGPVWTRECCVACKCLCVAQTNGCDNVCCALGLARVVDAQLHLQINDRICVLELGIVGAVGRREVRLDSTQSHPHSLMRSHLGREKDTKGVVAVEQCFTRPAARGWCWWCRGRATILCSTCIRVSPRFGGERKSAPCTQTTLSPLTM